MRLVLPRIVLQRAWSCTDDFSETNRRNAQLRVWCVENFTCYLRGMQRESLFEHEPSNCDEVDALADRIASSAATVDATMHELLAQIRRFDELKGWARQGAKTCAHWLSTYEVTGSDREVVSSR
jgi:hypothetical protein